MYSQQAGSAFLSVAVAPRRSDGAELSSHRRPTQSNKGAQQADTVPARFQVELADGAIVFLRRSKRIMNCKSDPTTNRLFPFSLNIALTAPKIPQSCVSLAVLSLRLELPLLQVGRTQSESVATAR